MGPHPGLEVRGASLGMLNNRITAKSELWSKCRERETKNEGGGREVFKRIYFYLEMPFQFLAISVHLMCLIFMGFPVINGVTFWSSILPNFTIAEAG